MIKTWEIKLLWIYFMDIVGIIKIYNMVYNKITCQYFWKFLRKWNIIYSLGFYYEVIFLSYNGVYKLLYN